VKKLLVLAYCCSFLLFVEFSGKKVALNLAYREHLTYPVIGYIMVSVFTEIAKMGYFLEFSKTETADY